MTRIYIDSEFNGHGGELISFGAVTAGNTSNWYGEFPPPANIHPWVKDHVVPALFYGESPPADDIYVPALYRGVEGKNAFRREFHKWITQFKNPEIICDWHADAAHFCDMLAGPDYGSSLDFPCRITILKTPPGFPKSEHPHNAFYDAVALMEWHMRPIQKIA